MISTLALSLPCLVLLGGSPWTHQGPLPTGLDLHDVEVISPTEAWITGEADAVYHTTDAGMTWTEHPLASASSWDLFFVDPQHGWVAGNEIFRTTDGGQNWVKSPTTLGTVNAVHFIDPLRGWAAQSNAVHRTVDGGLTWQAGLLPKHATCHGLFFVDDKIGFVANIDGEVFKTTDGGANWTTVLSSGGFNLNTVWFADPLVGYVCASDRVHATTDGGSSWQTLPLPPGTSWMYGGEFLDAQRAWLVGAGGEILVTTDGWSSATVQSTPASHSLFWGVSFADAQFGLAVGEEGQILATHDGGAHWTQRDSGGMDVHGVDANDAAHAWVALARGDVARTANGGAQWRTSAVDGFSLYGTVQDVDFTQDNLHGWAVGWDETFSSTSGRISRSTDGGRTWALQFSVPDGYVEAVAALDASTAVATGNLLTPGNLFVRTGDGGQNWQNVSAPLGHYSALDFVDGQYGWAAGARILSTTDGGFTWTEQTNPQWFMHDIDFHDPQHGWAVGAFGTILRTVDGGTNWSPVAAPPGLAGTTFTGVSVVAPGVAWITAFSNHVARTKDGGANWTVESLPFEPGFSATPSCVAFVDADYGWVGGSPRVDNGGPWRRADEPRSFALLNDRIRAGGNVTFRVGGAAPGDPILLGLSAAGIGLGPCFGTVCWGLTAPVVHLGIGVGDAAGRHAFTFSVPASVPLVEVSLQAVRPTGAPAAPYALTNTTTTPIEP